MSKKTREGAADRPAFNHVPKPSVPKPLPYPDSFSRTIDDPRWLIDCRSAWDAASQLRQIIHLFKMYYMFNLPEYFYVGGRVLNLKSCSIPVRPWEVEFDYHRDKCIQTLLKLQINSPSFIKTSKDAIVGRFPSHLPVGQVLQRKREVDRFRDHPRSSPGGVVPPLLPPPAPPKIQERLDFFGDLDNELIAYLETLEHRPTLAFVADRGVADSKAPAPPTGGESTPANPPSTANGKARKRGGGRRPEYDPKEDQRIDDAWKSKQYPTLSDLATELGQTKDEVVAARDRHRKRSGKTATE